MTATAASVLTGFDVRERTVVVTGATAGMGLASAHALAEAGARVLLVGRSQTALDSAVASVADVATGADPQAVLLDLASLASVRSGAEQLVRLAPSIDVLMNNAGVMFTPFGQTLDGFETQFGICHLGHFALTEALLPALRHAAAEQGRARVVVLASAGHKMGDIDLTDPHYGVREYDKFAAYGAAKTANILHAVGFAAAHPDSGVTAVSVHPGTVATQLARHMTRDDFSAMFKYGPAVEPKPQGEQAKPQERAVIATPEQGASTQVWAAVAPELDSHPGAYLADRAISTDVAPYAVDPERAAQLWRLSVAATG